MINRIIQGFCAGVCLAGVLVAIGSASLIAMPAAGVMVAACVGK